MDWKKGRICSAANTALWCNIYLQNFSATFQLNAIDGLYSDAANTQAANSTATIGKIPGYTIMDASLTYGFSKNYNFKAGVNNLADVNYFTRRAGGYPGPGLMPGNGRTFFVSIGAKF
ncbi:MAG: TonB-dependent receptor [Sphingobacteriaceae bacterium]|nr:TonB-dependent receptor [Sphingobacteriaceae bacterium]